MKRLAIMTVGKTHSGKTTFAKNLEDKLDNFLVLDQDNQAEFINTYYRKLQPIQGPNTLKYGLSKFLVDYAIENTDFHLIISNSNRSRKGRKYLLNELFKKEEFTRVLVHFDISEDVLSERVRESKRGTTIFRSASTFEEVLIRQQSDDGNDDTVDPVEGEADYLFVVENGQEAAHVIEKIEGLLK